MQDKRVGSQLKDFLRSGSLLSILIIVNVGLWLLMLLFPIVDYLYAMPSGRARAGWYDWLALSSDWDYLWYQPWTLLSYMFLHDGFWHIFFNMVMLFFGGTMCCRYLGTKRFGWLYFICGIVGGLFFLMIYNLFPVGRVHSSQLVGASAAILGVTVAVAVYNPNQEVDVWMVRTFPIKLKWMVLALIVIDLLTIPKSNAGGHVAHIGGALCGAVYVIVMRWLAERKTRVRPQRDKRATHDQRPLSDEEYNRRRAAEQKRIDEILDKISRSGYESLSREEKEILFRYK